ncbi:MAG TPA: 2-C-methyl-D-erythritol 2,4-cyclodiphosphate synthase, partial [Acidimicrobiales bacterium]|nr:2-C-methyl-D-erythritol 2,4-cyclodiphosphate synthase [Acidimicrobiales bacterium]
MTWRVGQGFDIHPFSDQAERPLVLGGVRVEGRGLRGHSDADVVCHAITDALLGAAGLGDIGTMFPDTDERWSGADSLLLLTAARDRLAPKWRTVNVDCTVVAEGPELAAHREQMEQKLSSILQAPVSVKAKRGEGLGALGRREGIACLAVVLISEVVEQAKRPSGAERAKRLSVAEQATGL